MQSASWNPRSLLIFALALQVVTLIIIALNVPFARQVIGFLYLTFVPGIILQRILRLNGLDVTEKILFSVGLSIAFLMFVGLLMNDLLPLMGVSKPLSFELLMIALNTGILLFFLLDFLGHSNNEGFRFSFPKNVRMSPWLLILFSLPVLSVAGAISVNVLGNNVILLLMIIIVAALAILISFSERLAPSKFYSLALLMMAVALLFQVSLISNYVNGQDIQVESYLFKLTLSNSYWNSSIFPGNPEYSRFNGMLSITILPSVYSSILNLDPVWVMKIIFPLIFSLVPLCLYKLYQTQGWGKKFAFLSTFFFISNETFYTEMLGLGKEMIAELFYVLLFFVLLNGKMKPLSKSLCFIIFSFGLVVSHYSIAYLFLFMILLAWIFSVFTKTKIRGITTSTVTLFFIITFSWYIYVSESGPFNALLSVGENVKNSFSEFFNPAFHQGVLGGLALEPAPTLGHLIGRTFAYATEIFIVIGFISLLFNRKKSILSKEFFIISGLNVVLLAMTITLPYLAGSFNMTRFYHVQLFFLAPFFVMGGTTFFRFVLDTVASKSLPPREKIFQYGSALKLDSKILILILIVLIPFFLYQTELVYEVTGDESWSIPLSKYRMSVAQYNALMLIYERDVFGASWLSKSTDPSREPLYADVKSRVFILPNYAMIERGLVQELNASEVILSNGTIIHLEKPNTVEPGGVIYLGQLNSIDGKMWGRQIFWNTSEISPLLNNMDEIYSNGGSEIYKEPSK